MCGITGVVFKGNSSNLQDIVKMNTITSHRGQFAKDFFFLLGGHTF